MIALSNKIYTLRGKIRYAKALSDTVSFKEYNDNEIHLILLDNVCLARNSEGCIFRLVTCTYNWALYEMTIIALSKFVLKIRMYSLEDSNNYFCEFTLINDISILDKKKKPFKT